MRDRLYRRSSAGRLEFTLVVTLVGRLSAVRSSFGHCSNCGIGAARFLSLEKRIEAKQGSRLAAANAAANKESVRKRGVVGAFCILVALAPTVSVRATPPDSQSQTWRISSPRCTVTEAWSQTPSAFTATSINAWATVECTDPDVGIGLNLSVVDVSTGFGAESSSVPSAYGSSRVSIIGVRPRRHLFRADLGVSFVVPGKTVLVGPPQCIPGRGAMQCSFSEVFAGLSSQPVSAAPPTPTPAEFIMAGRECWFVLDVVRTSMGIRYSAKQRCGGSAKLFLYLDPQEGIQLGQASVPSPSCGLLGGPACREPYGQTHGGFVPAPVGQTFTIDWYATVVGDVRFDVPAPGCGRTSYGEECEFIFNIVVAD